MSVYEIAYFVTYNNVKLLKLVTRNMGHDG